MEQGDVSNEAHESTSNDGNDHHSSYNSSTSRTRENIMNLKVLLICGLFIICLVPRFPGFYYSDALIELHEQCTSIYKNLTTICEDIPKMMNETMIFETPNVNYPQVLWMISPIANLGLLINSAANWIIYIYAGSRFRKIFIRKLVQFFCFLCKK